MRRRRKAIGTSRCVFRSFAKTRGEELQKSAGLQIIRKYDMQPGFFCGNRPKTAESKAFPLPILATAKISKNCQPLRAFPLGGRCRAKARRMRGATDSREMIFFSGFLAVILGFPFGKAVGDSRLKRSSPVRSSLGASRHSPRRGKQELRQKLSLPRRGKQENDEPPLG